MTDMTVAPHAGTVLSTEFERESGQWLGDQINNLTYDIIQISPSEWAEENRQLPEGISPIGGAFRYDVTPFLREIVDCMDIRSPVREVNVQKGAQVGATVGILENTIGYGIAQVKRAPMMMLTADAELAKLRMESYITPMLQQSDLMRYIRSNDMTNTRKTGKTDHKLEWIGGGSLTPFGALNANKLRSLSIWYLLEDEIDSYPDSVGRDGDPAKLAEARTKAYAQRRKILRLSTPLIKGFSRMEIQFERGDQRYFLVPCKKCGTHQKLVFSGERSDGEKYGLVWETVDGRVIPESTRYLCEYCLHPHTNDDKVWMLPRGYWQPSAEPIAPGIRSYHISGLYSPTDMYTWEMGVLDYLDAYDVEIGKVKSFPLMQEFYNNFLGSAWELQGDKISFVAVSAHRRTEYQYGQIPNTHAAQYTGGPIGLVVTTVDVQKDFLSVASFAFSPGTDRTRGGNCYLIQYDRLDGNPLDSDDAATWGALATYREQKNWVADDGREYPVALMLVDAGFQNEIVVDFCARWVSGVVPILGRNQASKNQRIQEFGEFTTQKGTKGFRLMVDMYKDRLSMILRRTWDGEGLQPTGHFNAPIDATDDELSELTKEYKREKREKRTNRLLGYEWHRPGSSRQELWDLIVYAEAALDLIAWDVCRNQFDLEQVNWAGFWDYIESNQLYYTLPKAIQ